MRATVLANKAAIDAFDLDSDGGDDYAFVRICAVPDDGGVVRDLPSGIEVVEGSQEDDPGDAGAAIEVWKKGKAGGFACACAMNATCQWKDGGSAWGYRGYTMDPGTWQGAGCLPKTCVVLQGRDVWPEECPQ